MEEDTSSNPSCGVGLDRMEESPPADDVLEWATEGEGMEVEVEGEILRDQDGAREKWGNGRAQCVSDLGGISIEREDPDRWSHGAHLRICGEGKQFQSSNPGRSGSRSRKTSELPSLRTNKKQYKCSECGKGFYRIASLSLHKTFHVPYECNECGKCFHHKSNLGLHENVHQAMRSMDCGKRVLLSRNLTEPHTTRDETQECKCLLCERIAGPQLGLEPHGAFHTMARSFQYLPCGESFDAESRFHDHKNTHRRRTT